MSYTQIYENTPFYEVVGVNGVNFIMLTILLVLVVLSGFFSMAETAVSSVSTYKLKMHVEDGVKGSKRALYITQNYDKTISTILVLSNMANIAIATISVGVVAGIIGSSGNVELISVVFTTIIVLTFGEVIPKTLGKNYSEGITLKIGSIMYLITVIMTPIVWFFLRLQKLFSKKDYEPEVDEEELEVILDTMEEEGAIEANDVKLIKNVFDLHDRKVEDIMTHRMEMLALDISLSNEEIKNILIENQYSRIPVYKEDKDHIIGILYEKEFLASYIQDPKFVIDNILKTVKYINKNMTVDTLIQELQHAKTHIAIVIGEYGDTLGLVTMEDCLEELVGEIYDEHDDGSHEEKLINKLNENSYLVDGETYIERLFDELEIGDAPEGQSKLASWIFEESKTLPEVGYTMNYQVTYTYKNDEDEYEDYIKNIRFEVTQVDSRRILEVLVTIEDIIDRR